LIEAVDQQYGVYRNGHFSYRQFEAYLGRQKLLDDWERTPEGRPKLERAYLRDMAKLHPQLEPFRELRYTVDELKLSDLAIGTDGRSRAHPSPFNTLTGRNNPREGRSFSAMRNGFDP
jgi:DNA polymerase-1